MINVLKAEWIKTKRTLLREFIILIPVVFSFLAFWQLTKVSLGSEAVLIRGLFFKFFFPMLVSFISSYLVGFEQIYGNGFYTNCRISKVKFYLGKVLSVFTYTISTVLIMDNTYFLILNFLKIDLPYKLLFFSSLMVFLGVFPIILLHVFVSFRWGMGYSISLGIVGTLLSAIVTSGLGHEIWYLIPWDIPFVLTLNFVVFLTNVKITEELTMLLTKYSPFQTYLNISLKGVISSIAYTVAILAIGLFCFNKWDGISVQN